MPAPDYAWLPLPAVLTYLGRDDDGDGRVEQARRAAAAYVEDHRPGLVYAGAAPADIPANVVEGAHLFVARLLARRNSPQGVATFGEFGPSQVLRLDPDVERLLGIGRYARPAVR